ncbi:hypothetical protein Tco_1149868 [Tanacetum coccineum]
MPLRMKTRSAGRSTTTPQGGRTGGQTGRGGGRTGEPRGRGDGQTSKPNIQRVEANGGVDGWNSQIRTRGRETDVRMAWGDFKTLIREEFCPNNEMQKVETEFWNHAMVGAGHVANTDRFH